MAHLAEALVGIRRDYARLVRNKSLDEILEMTGAETAREMELFGDLLNGMDAVTKDDVWLTPVFETAHRLWPIDHE